MLATTIPFHISSDLLMHCTVGSTHPPKRINWHNQRSGNWKSCQLTIMTGCSQVLAHIHKIFGTKIFQLLKWKSIVQGNIKGGLAIWNFVSYCQSLSGEQNLLNFVSVGKKKGKGRLWVLQHCCLEAYCTLTRKSSYIHLQRRCTHQAAWETSASKGRNYTWNLASNL